MMYPLNLSHGGIIGIPSKTSWHCKNLSHIRFMLPLPLPLAIKKPFQASAFWQAGRSWWSIVTTHTSTSAMCQTGTIGHCHHQICHSHCHHLISCGVACCLCLLPVHCWYVTFLLLSFAAVIVAAHSAGMVVCWCFLFTASSCHHHHCSWLFHLAVLRCCWRTAETKVNTICNIRIHNDAVSVEAVKM